MFAPTQTHAPGSAQSVKSTPFFQPKLTVNTPGDAYEQEADRVADQVMRMKNGDAPVVQRMPITPLSVQRKCDHCEKEEKAMRKETGGGDASGKAVLAAVSEVLSSGGGQPMDAGTRQWAESRFGQDFSQVRVHTDARAAESAAAIQARAYTSGSNVVFGAGEYQPQSESGQRLLAHELVHVGQQGGGGQRQVFREVCYQSGSSHTPSAMQPELHATYEAWLRSFTGMSNFRANDTEAGETARSRPLVLGTSAANDLTNQTTGGAGDPVPASGSVARGEEFIDHPTDSWVRACLPENLRQTAYALPADCADIAVILRHVWLSAHQRTESYRGWSIGSRSGDAEQRHIRGVIGNDVSSGNVDRMVNAYSDSQGNKLKDFEVLKNMLHPGDILVWEHQTIRNGRARRSGGHTQTITGVNRRRDGQVTISVLQGNQPINQDAAADIISDTPVATAGREQELANSREGQRLRDLPGRRIESSSGVINSNTVHLVTGENIWGREDEPLPTGERTQTVIVAVGPPAAARRSRRSSTLGQMSDWTRALNRAEIAQLPGVLESTLQALRAQFESGGTVPDSEIESLARSGGENIWRRAHRAADLGNTSHFQPVQLADEIIQGFIALGSRNALVAPALMLFRQTFIQSARGMGSVDFARRIGRREHLVKILVTGFDPFNTSDQGGPLDHPGAAEWNPSGAAALALDGTTLSAGGGRRVALEGVVFPVSFSEFNQGIVENLIRPLAQNRGVDAILTVSLDPNLSATDPVRLEQFVVGTRNEGHILLRRVPTTEGGARPILESGAPLQDIATATSSRSVQRPDIGTDIRFRFASVEQANEALIALGLTPQGVRSPTIGSTAALHTITSTMTRLSDGISIRFTVRGQPFDCMVLEGPAGNFLSNEISYRVLNTLLAMGRGDIISFHTHVPSSGSAPAGNRVTRQNANRSRTRTIETLRRMAIAVANQVPVA